MENETKPCPFCAETIKAAAIVCRFCSRDLLPRDQMDAERNRQEETKQRLEAERARVQAEAERKRAARRAGDIVTNKRGMKFAWRPPGTFTMDDGNNFPKHKVTLTKGFYLGSPQ